MENDYNKLKAEKITLQKNLVKEREEKQKLRERNEELEAACKRKTEEIEALQLGNQQLVHKCQALQEKTTEKNTAWGGWFGSSTNSKKIMENARILEEELQNKIVENEQVHIKNFELRQHYKGKIQDLKEKAKQNESYLRTAAEKIEAMAIEILQYQSSVQNLFKESKEYSSLVDEKNKELQDSHNYFLKTANDLKTKIGYLQGKLQSVVSLDLTDYEEYAVGNAPKFNRNFQFKQNEWLGKIWISLKGSVGIFQPFFENYCLRLELLFQSSPPSCKKILQELRKSAEKALENYSELIRIVIEVPQDYSGIIQFLGKFETYIVYFFRILKLAISKEEYLVHDPEKISKANNEILSHLRKIGILISRAISFLICSAYTKHSTWGKLQDLAKSFTSTVTEAFNVLTSRLLLDKVVKYKAIVKDTQPVNNEINKQIQQFTIFLSTICSEILQLRPNFYYSLNPLCKMTSNYLQSLREIPHTTGVPYSQSLENVESLLQAESKIKEQSQNISSLEKNNSNLVREIEKYKAEVTKIENELAAVEQNLDRKTIEPGNGILHDHESISEDVKSGAQRFAMRLTDVNGEPVPLSALNLSNDLYLKIQELAINKINELSEQIKKINK